MLTDDIIRKVTIPSRVLLEEAEKMRAHSYCGSLAVMQELIPVGQTRGRAGEEAVGPCWCGEGGWVSTGFQIQGNPHSQEAAFTFPQLPKQESNFMQQSKEARREEGGREKSLDPSTPCTTQTFVWGGVEAGSQCVCGTD